MTNRYRLVHVMMLCLLLIGCSEEALNSQSSNGKPTVVKEKAKKPAKEACFSVINGRSSDDHDNVIKMVSPSTCTMTVLSENTLLTAAHCLEHGITNLQLAEHGTRKVLAIKTRGLDGSDAEGLLSNPENIGRDIALVQIDPPLKDVTPAKLTDDTFTIENGDPVEILGYGLTSTVNVNGALQPSGSPSERLIKGPNVLFDAVGAALYVTTQRNDVQSAMGLPGDSGGPLLADGRVIGIMHKGTANFSMGGIESVLLTTEGLLARLNEQNPQYLGVWVNLMDADLRAFLHEAKSEGFAWSSDDKESAHASSEPKKQEFTEADPSAPTKSRPCTDFEQDLISTEDVYQIPFGTGDSDSVPHDYQSAEAKQTDDIANEGPPATTIRAYVEKMNSVRSQAAVCGVESMPAVAPLTWDNLLYQAALRHSEDLYEHGISGHQGSDGSMPNNRVDDVGYRYATVGENVATGFFDLDVVYAAWMDSPGHCVNNMAPYYSEFALAEVNGVWTLVFGRPR